MTLNEAIQDFLLEQRVRGNSPKTLAYYENLLNIFSQFAGTSLPIQDVQLPLLRKYSLALDERSISSISKQSYIRGLRAFLSFCYGEGYLPSDLSEKFRLPKAQRKEINILTDEEVHTLMSSFDTRHFIQLRNYCICALMLDSGLRMNEAATLTLDNLHVHEGYAIVDGKGGKQRSVPLGNCSKKMLLRYLRRRPGCAQTNQVFITSALNPIRRSTITQLFRKLKKKTGIARLRPHLLRHTFATRYLENGGDMYTLQSILGHTSLEMVRKYVHLTTRKTVLTFPKFSPLDNIG